MSGRLSIRTRIQWAAVALLAAVAVAVGINFGRDSEAVRIPVAKAAVPKPAVAESSQVQQQQHGDGEKTPRFEQAVVYLDGKPLAMIRFGELPARTPIAWQTLQDGRKVRRFRVTEYLTALGVRLGRVREAHFYGGRGRVAILPGSELRRVRNGLLFSFTQEVKGKARMHWPAGIRINDTIDTLQNLVLYETRTPPRWNVERGQLELAGEPIEGIPYAEGKLRNGARVYVNGTLAGVLSRRTVQGYVQDKRAQAQTFRLLPQLASLGVDVQKIVGADIVAEEATVGRLTPAELAQAQFSMLPERGSPIQLTGRHVSVNALLLQVEK